MTKLLRHPKVWQALGLLVLLFLFQPHSAQAYSCTAASPGTQSFGSNVSPVSGNSYSFTGTIAVTCTVGALEGLVTGTVIRACLSISGSSGSTPRTLSSGGGTAQYNLYSDAAHTQVFGSVSSTPAAAVAVDFPLGLLGILTGGTATLNVSVYGYMPSGQTTLTAGTYSQSFSGTGTQLNYTGYTLTPPTCSGAWANGGTYGFTVNATVINDCNINATDIAFPNTGVLSSALYRTGTVAVQCTSGDSYSISLNAGTTTGSTVSSRYMVSALGGTVQYGLYTTGGYTTIWGDGSLGTATQGGTGTGSGQSFTVYGVVPIQATPAPGTYNDTVTATITY
jgi:spore coat protein U-like protein